MNMNVSPQPVAGPQLIPEVEALRQKLIQELSASVVHIVDNSWMHAGHAAAPQGVAGGSHLAILIVTEKFDGVSLLDQHRMVQQVIKPEMDTMIHALELKTYTPAGWEKLQQQFQ